MEANTGFTRAGAEVLDSFLPTANPYRRNYLFFYKWKQRLENIWECVKPIFYAALNLTFGGAIGALIFHSVVCGSNHQDFRHFCGNEQTDIIISLCGSIIGVLGTYYLRKYCPCEGIKYFFWDLLCANSSNNNG
tara:strand:+ start:125 stop:526 length:402 start_codon:yes stop_codon:yes gene_type:complete